MFWNTRHRQGTVKREKDIIFHFSMESHKGGEVGEAIIRMLIRLRSNLQYTVWTRDEIPNLPDQTVYRFLSEEELCALYRSHKFLLFPSTFEGFGLPPIESMACGCIPILYPRIGAADLYAADGKNVVFIGEDIEGTAEKINSLLDNDAAMKRMQTNALDAISPFSPAGYGMRLLNAAGVRCQEENNP